MNVAEYTVLSDLTIESVAKISPRQCTQCIMDDYNDPVMDFDENGVCFYCRYYEEQKKRHVKEGAEGIAHLLSTLNTIKEYGKNKKYDCLIGLSGGVDSSYVAYVAKQHGLRPLCVHFDNGWNSELAVKNIHNIVSRLGFDLNTLVIDWEEFKDLQLAYLRASVIDIEVITDHAIYGSIFKIAKEHNIKYILGGHNVATESILPRAWAWNIKDYINIKHIHKLYGQRKLKTFPFLTKKLRRSIDRSGLEFINFLNWMPYKKEAIKATLQEELDWRDYGNKHHESIWTRFFQVYILPVKFGVDKRKAHLSNLICSGQLTREEALAEMEKPVCDEFLLEHDKQFVLKKLGLSEREFDAIMNMPPRHHTDFDVEGSFFNYYPLFRPVKPLWELFKSITGYHKAS